MKDRRKYKRSDILFYARIYDKKNGSLLGHLGNITPEGLMVISDRPIEPESIISIRIELPDAFAEKSYIEVTARSVWCVPDINPNFYDAGFQLQEVSPDDLEIIERMITEYRFRE
jgi:hypothetical protein